MSKTRWEDMVFVNRNQSYGAYQLRKAYASRVGAAFVLAMGVVSVIVAYPMMKPSFESESAIDLPKKRMTILDPPPAIDVPVVPPPKLKMPDLKEIKFVSPKVTDQEVDETPPTMEQIKDALISTQPSDGDSVVVDFPPVVETPTPEPEDPNKVYTTVEQQPEFPGGLQEMMKFIAKNTKYPASARRMGIQGTVYISFVVNPDGTIDTPQAIKGIHTDCDNEAIRVISKMPSWKPGKQNGKAVKVRFVLPIKYAMGD